MTTISSDIRISPVHQWWDEDYDEDEEVDDSDNPYYPEVLGVRDIAIYQAATIINESFTPSGDLAYRVHDLHTKFGKADVDIVVMRAPDMGCAMGCCLRQYIGSPVAVGIIEYGHEFESAHFHSLCVTPDERGKGLGTALLDFMVRWSDHRGVRRSRMWLIADKGREGWYQKNGWVMAPPSRGERMYGLGDGPLMYRANREE